MKGWGWDLPAVGQVFEGVGEETSIQSPNAVSFNDAYRNPQTQRPKDLVMEGELTESNHAQCMLALGIRNESIGSVYGVHTGQFFLDESTLPLGAAIHTSLAQDFLAQGGFEVRRETL